MSALAGFDSAWEGFHRLIFSNDFWQLNPRTDHLIQIFPPAFWESIVFFIGVLIVAAGMEGALPGVVSGLVDKPVIAVPTSVGYGASFGGLAALLGMLNCCGSGVTVVNIDNGFGAACAADDILRLASG